MPATRLSSDSLLRDYVEKRMPVAEHRLLTMVATMAAQPGAGGILCQAGLVCRSDGAGGRAHTNGLALDCSAGACLPRPSEAAPATATFFAIGGVELDECKRGLCSGTGLHQRPHVGQQLGGGPERRQGGSQIGRPGEAREAE